MRRRYSTCGMGFSFHFRVFQQVSPLLRRRRLSVCRVCTPANTFFARSGRSVPKSRDAADRSVRTPDLMEIRLTHDRWSPAITVLPSRPMAYSTRCVRPQAGSPIFLAAAKIRGDLRSSKTRLDPLSARSRFVGKSAVAAGKSARATTPDVTVLQEVQ